MSTNFCLWLPNVSAELIESTTYSEFEPFVRPGERPLLVTVDLWTAKHDTDADFDVDVWESCRVRILIDDAIFLLDIIQRHHLAARPAAKADA